MYGLHAYNAGWNITDKTRDNWLLGINVFRDCKEKQLHAICISEVFEVEYPADEVKKVDERRQDILKFLSKRLNDAVYGGWYGRQDAHTLHIWHESLNLFDSDFVSLQVPTQPWRKTIFVVSAY